MNAMSATASSPAQHPATTRAAQATPTLAIECKVDKIYYGEFLAVRDPFSGLDEADLDAGVGGPADHAVDAEVDLGTAGTDYFLQARLNVSLPGLERDVAQAVVDAADQTCPYSKAIRGNVDVVIKVV